MTHFALNLCTKENVLKVESLVWHSLFIQHVYLTSTYEHSTIKEISTTKTLKEDKAL